MDSLINISIWSAIVLIIVAIVTIALFGIRNMTQGKVNPFSAATAVVPIVLLLVLGFTMGDWDQAGIVTALIMIAIAGLSLLLSGLRSMTGM